MEILGTNQRIPEEIQKVVDIFNFEVLLKYCSLNAICTSSLLSALIYVYCHIFFIKISIK